MHRQHELRKQGIHWWDLPVNELLKLNAK